jgi:hypothetical protein
MVNYVLRIPEKKLYMFCRNCIYTLPFHKSITTAYFEMAFVILEPRYPFL